MAKVTKPTTFSSGQTAKSAEVNTNFDTIYNDYNGNITNANIAASAAIAGSKLDLSSPGTIGGTTPGNGAFVNLVATTLTANYLTLATDIGTDTPVANALYSKSIVKAWVTFNGTGTMNILDSYNVSGISDSAAGQYFIQWDNNFTNTNYCVVAMANEVSTQIPPAHISTSQARVDVLNASGTTLDATHVCIMVVGD